jgi:hypothetical protein
MLTIVNMIPRSMSNEIHQDSEPNVAVNPANPLQIAASAFTPDPMGGANCPIFISFDGGNTWILNSIIPSTPNTNDTTLRFGGSSNILYAAILHPPTPQCPKGSLNVLRTYNFSSMVPMTALEPETRCSVDQPYIQATTVIGGIGIGKDRIYIGNNDFNSKPRTATIDQSLDAASITPAFNSIILETRPGVGQAKQDGPPIRPAIHPSGIVYGIYYGYRHFTGSFCTGGTAICDVVVVRDDNWGIGSRFWDLIDPTDSLSGIRVVRDIEVPWGSQVSVIGLERLAGSHLSIAVHPGNNRMVYIAWADRQVTTGVYTLHIRKSTDSGRTWSVSDIKTVSNAINPALAVNIRGKVGFLYQQLTYGWQTHLELTDNDFATSDNLVLATVPNDVPLRFFPYMGDYVHLMAVGKDFYGVFSTSNFPDMANFPSGVTYQRNANFSTHTLLGTDGTTVIQPSIDPFFVKVAQIPDTDFYVRDWTESAISHDTGLEPSTYPLIFQTSDVWNRHDNSPGAFNANDQPVHEDPQMFPMDNFAFARICRNAAGTSESVKAHFLYSDFGIGSNYRKLSFADDLDVNFASGMLMSLTAGFRWNLPWFSSNHLRLAVEISTLTDPIISPSLLGHTPGWPTTDLMIINDNNKAQRNMGVYPISGVGQVSFYVIIHNGATFPRDVNVLYESAKEIDNKLEEARIEIIGGHSQPFRSGNIITLENMQPGENRWIGLTLEIPRIGDNELISVIFQEIVNKMAVDGFGICAQPSTLNAVIQDNLKIHASVFKRISFTFNIDRSEKESLAARNLFFQEKISSQTYLEFLRLHVKSMGIILSELIMSHRADDPFGIQIALENLQNAVQPMSRSDAENMVQSGDVNVCVLTHSTLLHKLDAFVTMLQKSNGDPADILQNVIWQKELYSKIPDLKKLEFSVQLVERSEEFIHDFEMQKVSNIDYPKLVSYLLEFFSKTSKALAALNLQLEKDVEDMNHNLSSEAALQRVHHGYLLKLQSLDKKYNDLNNLIDGDI